MDIIDALINPNINVYDIIYKNRGYDVITYRKPGEPIQDFINRSERNKSVVAAKKKARGN